MGRKRTYVVFDVIEACKTLGTDLNTPPELRMALIKCLQIVTDAEARQQRNEELRTQTNHRRAKSDTDKHRINELREQIKKYRPDLATQKAAGNVKLGEMFDAWQAELAQLTGKEV